MIVTIIFTLNHSETNSKQKLYEHSVCSKKMIEIVVHRAGSSFRFGICNVQHSRALTLICSSLMLWQCTYKNLSPKQVTVSALVRKKWPQKQALSLVPRALVCNLHLLPGFLMEVQRNVLHFPGPKAAPRGQHREVVLQISKEVWPLG